MRPDHNTIDPLPHDAVALQTMVRVLLVERDGEKKRADELHVRLLRMEVELARLKKWYYGPRADKLTSDAECAQMLLEFGQSLDRKPVDAATLSANEKPEEQLRRVRRARGRRNIERFENLPTTTHVYELSTEERACPCCGTERKEIGVDESWQVEYIPGRFEPGSPRTGLRPWGGSVCIMCAKSTPAQCAMPKGKARASKPQ